MAAVAQTDTQCVVHVLASQAGGQDRLRSPSETQPDTFALLSEDIRDRIRARLRQEDRQRSLRAYALALEGAMRLYGRSAADLKIASLPGGKPGFAASVGLVFNCSHSGAWVVCGLTAQEHGVEAIGIDVEEIAARPDYAPLRFFHASEKAWVEQRVQRDRPEAFYQLWTLKESYVKALGFGLSVPLDSFEVRFDAVGRPFIYPGSADAQRAVLTSLPDALPGYSVAVCVLTRPPHRIRPVVRWRRWP